MTQALRTEFLAHAQAAMTQRSEGGYTPLAAGFHSAAGIRPVEPELVQAAVHGFTPSRFDGPA